MNFTSSNPAMKRAFESVGYAQAGTEVMSLKGTINKSLLSLLLILLAASYTWSQFASGNPSVNILMLVGGIGGFVVAIATSFKKEWAPYTVPVYAVLEGLFLGGISAFFAAYTSGGAEEGVVDDSIVIKAVTLTFGVFFAMLFAYRSGMIKATAKFKTGVIAATGGIAIAYLLMMVLGWFGIDLGFFYGNSWPSIGISLFVVIIAALNLILDFDFIEKGAQMGLPKYMEWYGAFGLMVTLIWLYIEILILLSKISSRD
ncbi:MAG: Bax inhibitor-1/YccA family protein [Bacteroidales bacterium]|nr:Bax inhibitor-1/YccA family protein [Bacteroidales bacterium]MCF8458123.1 Bax inhibitor-1/YccA family protein [Bacteroidales bacterium]